jgi:hypothetical protein
MSENIILKTYMQYMPSVLNLLKESELNN